MINKYQAYENVTFLQDSDVLADFIVDLETMYMIGDGCYRKAKLSARPTRSGPAYDSSERYSRLRTSVEKRYDLLEV